MLSTNHSANESSKTELSQVFGTSSALRLQPSSGILFALFFGQGQPDSNLNSITTTVAPVKLSRRGQQRYLVYCSVCGDKRCP
jgi:hypothetical protein